MPIYTEDSDNNSYYSRQNSVVNNTTMDGACVFGVLKRGKPTLIYRNYEYWKIKSNSKGETLWRCNKFQTFRCKAYAKTKNDNVVKETSPEHTHARNAANALVRKAIGQMKNCITENLATPSASQGASIVNLDGHVQMALPKRVSLSRVLRRHRQVKAAASNNGVPLPPIPTDKNFDIPARFHNFLMYDSGVGDDRLLIFGDRHLLEGLERAEIWLADGTFKAVPTIFSS